MKAPPFRYVKPNTLDEALALLSEHSDDAQILAGGQSLMPLLNLRMARPGVLIDINGLEELHGIARDDNDLTLGALTRHAEIAASPDVREAAPLLALAAPHIAHVAIRTRGTLGGSLALADPAAEWPLCALALTANVEVTSRARGARWIAADDFFQGLYTTARAADEIVTRVRVPVAGPATVHHFDEIARRHGDFAIVALALTARRDGDRLANVRIALSGVADRPVLARGAMTALNGVPFDAAHAEAAVEALSADIDPPDDSAYPAAYRRRLAATLLSRALAKFGASTSHAA